MKMTVWNRLSREHKEILEKHMQECPVKVGQIAKDLGVKIKVSGMRMGISGQIKREEDGHVIRVNRYEARRRQRFTIAHELAHFLLHKSLIDSSPDGITDNILYRSGAPENTEYEANRLAAEIVMPTLQIEKMLQGYSKKITDETIEDFAEHFQVSKAAMEIRLRKFT